jgi:lipid-A-disaccharide synthase-like uncharacterized protein
LIGCKGLERYIASHEYIVQWPYRRNKVKHVLPRLA